MLFPPIFAPFLHMHVYMSASMCDVHRPTPHHPMGLEALPREIWNSQMAIMGSRPDSLEICKLQRRKKYLLEETEEQSCLLDALYISDTLYPHATPNKNRATLTL